MRREISTVKAQTGDDIVDVLAKAVLLALNEPADF